MDGLWSEPERFHVERMTRVSAVGSPETVRHRLAEIAAETEADELILATQAYDHAARLQVVRARGTGPRSIDRAQGFIPGAARLLGRDHGALRRRLPSACSHGSP